jgi:hypothetical protein
MFRENHIQSFSVLRTVRVARAPKTRAGLCVSRPASLAAYGHALFRVYLWFRVSAEVAVKETFIESINKGKRLLNR